MIDFGASLGVIGYIVDLGSKGLEIIGICHSIYKSIDGAPEDLARLQARATGIRASIDKLLSASSSSAEGLDAGLDGLVEASKALDNEVKSITSGLAIKAQPSPWEAFKCGCRTWWRLPKIKDVQSRPVEQQQHIATRFIALIRYHLLYNLQGPS